MKIEAAFCDVHPARRLTETAFKIPSRSTFPDERALRCTGSDCSRHFHYDFGYFPLIGSEEPDVGNLAEKPSCKNKHDLIYMLLTRVDGELLYACFHPECTVTKPYKK